MCVCVHLHDQACVQSVLVCMTAHMSQFLHVRRTRVADLCLVARPPTGLFVAPCAYVRRSVFFPLESLMRL